MRQQKNRKARPVWAIIGDGFSEKIYFESLKTYENLPHLTIKPELPGSRKGGEFMGVFEKAGRLFDEGYDRVFCLIDMDTVLANGKLVNFQSEKVKIERRGGTVLECNPCFEVWFLLHFQKTGRPFDDCDEICRMLRKEVGFENYSKEKLYHQSQNFYEKLNPFLSIAAVPNAMFLEQNREIQSPKYPRCEVYKLFFELGFIRELTLIPFG